jgi:hypothetical protein
LPKIFYCTLHNIPKAKYLFPWKFIFLSKIYSGCRDLVRAASQKLSGHGCPAINIRQSEIFAEALLASLGRAGGAARTRLGKPAQND